MTAFEKGMSWYKIKAREQPLLLTYLGFIPYLSMATFLKVYNHVNQLNIFFLKLYILVHVSPISKISSIYLILIILVFSFDSLQINVAQIS